jgi:hypothetical protein
MTIHQLREPCFELSPRPWDDGFNPHYATPDEAADALSGMREERDPSDLADLAKVAPEVNPAGCWVGECDGCGDVFTDEETGANHYETSAELDAAMPASGWVYQGGDQEEFWPEPGSWVTLNDALLLCPGCRQGAPVLPPPTPAEQEAAGQLRLVP